MDARLLGAFAAAPPASIVRPARRMAAIGLLLMAATGSVLFTAEASHVAMNRVFQIKAVLIALGVHQCGARRQSRWTRRSRRRRPSRRCRPACGCPGLVSLRSGSPWRPAGGSLPISETSALKGRDRRYNAQMSLQTTKPNRAVRVGGVTFANDRPIALFAGPCQMESRAHALEMASALKEIAGRLGIGLVYKTSFDKANRTSLTGKRGIGLDGALPVFAEIRESLGLPVVTDVHEAGQCARVAEAVDVLQIPAFLCRQTDLLIAAAKTGRAVKVKKGQFLAPWDMKNVVAKITESGNPNVLVTERGASFGYNTLVVDMRALPIMAEIGCPVIFDATHAVQQPGGQGTASGGDRTLRAGAGAGRRGGRRRGPLHRDAPGPRPRALGRPQHGAAQGFRGPGARADGDRRGGEEIASLHCLRRGSSPTSRTAA